MWPSFSCLVYFVVALLVSVMNEIAWVSLLPIRTWAPLVFSPTDLVLGGIISKTWPGSTLVDLYSIYSYYFHWSNVRFLLWLLSWGRVIRTARVPRLKGSIAASLTALTCHSKFLYFIYFEWVWLYMVITFKHLIKFIVFVFWFILELCLDLFSEHCFLQG